MQFTAFRFLLSPPSLLFHWRIRAERSIYAGILNHDQHNKEMTDRVYIIAESNWQTVRNTQYNIAVLPWGATEAHNFHLPYATDIIESEAVAAEAVSSELAHDISRIVAIWRGTRARAWRYCRLFRSE